MGTGTAFLWAEQGKPVRHLCGSGIGGGTLGGLCRQMAGAERFHRIAQLAAGGDLKKVDLTVRDLARDTAATLDPDMTAANFGNLAEDVSPADLAAGAVNLVLQAIGTMTVLACRSCATDTAILTGSVTSLSQAAENFRLFERLYGLRCIIPEKATFATALGAALTAAKS
jgi:type II pantothenate kinase